MRSLISSIAIVSVGLLTLCNAQLVDESLVGTWTTKSKAVYTGPGFYNPVKDEITEPKHPGISYSFTKDGYYESAQYRAVSNPRRPECPSAVIQWQHGKYTIESNGSLLIKPIAVDGRQVMSRPCSSDQSVYTRYSQPEMMERYEVITDPYHNVKRLNLFGSDGAPYHPMYLAYSPPQMLPTLTLNPTATGSGSKETSKSRLKRSLDEDEDESETNYLTSQQGAPLKKMPTFIPTKQHFNPDRWWWVGIGLTAVGSMLYMYPSS